jgi:hypothetical protein
LFGKSRVFAADLHLIACNEMHPGFHFATAASPARVMILPSTTVGEWRADTELSGRRDARA